MQSRAKPNPGVWYNWEVLGENSIGKVIGDLMRSAGYEGFFSGHPLRRTDMSRLFQVGVQRKIVKEGTGHTSDAVDSYQITSDHQRSCVSKILQSNPRSEVPKCETITSEVRGNAIDFVSTPQSKITTDVPKEQEKCKCQSSGYGGLVEQIISQVNATGKAKIKIEIEIPKD